MQFRRANQGVLAFFIVLGLSFASYDLIIFIFAKSASLLNFRVQDGYRVDEGYMYFAGVGKTVFFDPYLLEGARSLTLRPPIPTILFALIYWLCAENLNLAIFIGHTIPPLISCILLYLIGLRLSGSKRLATLAVLLAVGHFAFSLLVILARIIHEPVGGIGGPDLYLLKQLFPHVGALGNITAPNQFTRLFSPALTLPFLLTPIYLLLKGGHPGLRGFLISINLYVYPHHVLVLACIEFIFYLRNRQLPSIRFFIWGLIAALPYGVQLWLVHQDGNYIDMYGRVGQTRDLSPMWFFCLFFATTSLVIYRKSRALARTHQPDQSHDPLDVADTSKSNMALVLSLGCLLAATGIWILDSLLNFPQVHLVGLRIFAFLAPLVFVCTLGVAKDHLYKRINIVLLCLVVFSQAYPAWVNRGGYSDPERANFSQELSALPPGAVVMTQIQKDIAYVAVSKQYSYLGYGIVSSASNAELMKRFVVLSKIYDWPDGKLKSGNWDDLMPVRHWIWHHGAETADITNQQIDAIQNSLTGLTKCQLLAIYRVDYLYYQESIPKGIEECTAPHSNHWLKIEH